MCDITKNLPPALNIGPKDVNGKRTFLMVSKRRSSFVDGRQIRRRDFLGHFL